MNFSEFIGHVQNRLELPEEGPALRATRAVLTTLAERIQKGEATDLAGPLPMEIDRYLTEAESGQRFDYDEFLGRIADRAEIEESDASRYAIEVLAVVSEAVPETELEQVRDQLPEEFAPVFSRTGVAESNA